MRKERWEMDEYDEPFTMELLEETSGVAKSLQVKALVISVTEKYDDEEKPHYDMQAGFGLTVDLPASRLFVRYNAIADGNSEKGAVEIVIRADAPHDVCEIILAMTFGLYDKAIRKYYPQWETNYDLATLSINAGGLLKIPGT